MNFKLFRYIKPLLKEKFNLFWARVLGSEVEKVELFWALSMRRELIFRKGFVRASLRVF